MKEMTKALGYGFSPSHGYRLILTAFPPIVNPNYLEMWAEFIFMSSAQELYSRYKDPKQGITVVALAFINYLKTRGVPAPLVRNHDLSPARITVDAARSRVAYDADVFRHWLESKLFNRHFLISNRRVRLTCTENSFLRLRMPMCVDLNIELVTRDNLHKVWSTYPDGYWPTMPKKMACNFKAFCSVPDGVLSAFGEHRAAILTGDLLAIRVRIPISDVLMGRMSISTIERNLTTATKGKL